MKGSQPSKGQGVAGGAGDPKSLGSAHWDGTRAGGLPQSQTPIHLTQPQPEPAALGTPSL